MGRGFSRVEIFFDECGEILVFGERADAGEDVFELFVVQESGVQVALGMDKCRNKDTVA